MEIWVLYSFVYSVKGVWKISLSSWLPENLLCLEFLLAKPTQVNGLRAAVIKFNPPPQDI